MFMIYLLRYMFYVILIQLVPKPVPIRMHLLTLSLRMALGHSWIAVAISSLFEAFASVEALPYDSLASEAWPVPALTSSY